MKVERHEDVSLNKIYKQFRDAGIKLAAKIHYADDTFLCECEGPLCPIYKKCIGQTTIKTSMPLSEKKQLMDEYLRQQCITEEEILELFL